MTYSEEQEGRGDKITGHGGEGRRSYTSTAARLLSGDLPRATA
ncbi:uncharacterized protein G2W53_029574 [Senna tora]|uniref:Uncharacterized protein n=1 Tax=Senna tora TaxID=362788 RepID=A0A834T4Y7_9FABA|nr:uncharacterized protein G2W53_029574 [Senna tora]